MSDQNPDRPAAPPSPGHTADDAEKMLLNVPWLLACYKEALSDPDLQSAYTVGGAILNDVAHVVERVWPFVTHLPDMLRDLDIPGGDDPLPSGLRFDQVKVTAIMVLLNVRMTMGAPDRSSALLAVFAASHALQQFYAMKAKSLEGDEEAHATFKANADNPERAPAVDKYLNVDMPISIASTAARACFEQLRQDGVASQMAGSMLEHLVGECSRMVAGWEKQLPPPDDPLRGIAEQTTKTIADLAASPWHQDIVGKIVHILVCGMAATARVAREHNPDTPIN